MDTAAMYQLGGSHGSKTLFPQEQESNGHGGGQVVNVIAFHSDNPSSNPADAYVFSVKIVLEKTKNKQKQARVGPIKKNITHDVTALLNLTKLTFWSSRLLA